MILIVVILWFLGLERLRKSFATKQNAGFRLKDGMHTW